MGAAAQSADWREDWALADGLTMEVASEGYRTPTSIAVVPEPGPGPDAPLYFVTELEGTIKVVSRSGEVRTFAADFFRRDVLVDLPEEEAETGLAGICLAPDQGYVFATYAYEDDAGILRNAIRRFETVPIQFSLTPVRDTLIAGFLAEDISGVSHQIGNCTVRDGSLYVGVGDGHRPSAARSLTSSLGKIHRITLDGEAPTDNPHWSAEDPSAPASYVWAAGFRNPFALTFRGGDLFVAANGPEIDRIVLVRPGRDYRWDGSNQSIATTAEVSFYPAISPVQIAYNEAGGALPPEFDGDLLVATSGGPITPAAESPMLAKAMISLSWNPVDHRLDQAPRILVKYVGDGIQALVGLALTPTGVLLVPLFPLVGDRSVVLRVSHDTTNSWPTRLDSGALANNAIALIERYGCRSCHGVQASDTTRIGPTLHGRTMAERIRARVDSDEYRATLRELNASARPDVVGARPARQRLLDAPPDSSVWTYVYNQVRNPRFDNPASAMPVMNLTEEEARTLADHLLDGVAEPPAPEPPPGPIDRLYDALQRVGLVPDSLRYRHLGIAFFSGLFFALVLVAGGIALRKRRDAGRMT